MTKSYHLFRYHASDERMIPGSCRAPEAAGFTVIAHRGASAYYPENTMAAFRGAIDMEADMVELDVQLTSDGEAVVFHDEKISRCTNGRGSIAGYSYAELKKLDAGSWFDKKFAGARVPALRDVLDLCKGRIAVNIEIKKEAVTDIISGGIEEKCLKMVDQAGMQEHVVFSSFDPRALSHLRQIGHQAPVAVLFEKKYYGSMLPSQIIEWLGADAFNCSRRELGRKWLADLKYHGIPVNVYTVNDEKNMNRLLSLGVDGMFTNYPDVLKRVQRATSDERCVKKY
ncbi:MAG: glycerophosphodiester phosphodiesterase family protein [Smithellaceae bacterium]